MNRIVLRRTVIAVLVVILSATAIAGAIVAAAIGGDSHDGDGAERSRIYSYEEAKELGLVGPRMSDPAGLPKCSPAQISQGPPTDTGNGDLPGQDAACALDPGASGAVVLVPAPEPGDPVLMTYWEARRAGLDVSALPAKTGFRVCTDADFHRGFSSAEEAERSLAEYEAKWGEEGPDICQVDPTTATIAVFPPGRGPASMLP